MRTHQSISLMILISVLSLPQMNSQTGVKATNMEKAGKFETRQDYPKGGIGILNLKLYVVTRTLRTGKNELIIRIKDRDETWSGKGVTEPEIIFFYADKVWTSSQGLPNDFNLSHAIVVSFEKDKIRYFDFAKEFGAYFNRTLE